MNKASLIFQRPILEIGAVVRALTTKSSEFGIVVCVQNPELRGKVCQGSSFHQLVSCCFMMIYLSHGLWSMP
ncbi:unnamed protein product [Lathyrus oleraceus]